MDTKTKTVRLPGQRKTDLSDESTPKVLKIAKQLVRMDFGGKNPDEVIKKKALEAGLDLGPKTRAFVLAIAEEQVAACRKRAFPRINEAIVRLDPQEEIYEERSN
jgi:hypothetical protein